MRFDKPHYFIIYKSNLKSLFLILFLTVLIGCQRQKTSQNFHLQSQAALSEQTININIASAEELEKLPHVGKETAKKIVVFRETYGKFRRAENLILVGGMSDKKFRDIRSLVRIE